MGFSFFNVVIGFDSSDATCAHDVYLPACQDTTDSIAFGGPSQFIKIDQVSDVSGAVESEWLKEGEIHMMGINISPIRRKPPEQIISQRGGDDPFLLNDPQ